jgi:hypothetical protein
MKMKMILIAVLAVIFSGGAMWLLAQTNAASSTPKVLYYTCPMHPSVKSDKPGNCPYCGMELEAVYATDAATNAPSSVTNSPAADTRRPTPYPLTTCVVSGERLGEMGEPIEFVYTNNGANQEIKFCCPDCPPVFLKDPNKYLKKIQDAEGQK